MNRLKTWLVIGAAVLPSLQAFGQGSIVYVNPVDVLVGSTQTPTSFDLNGDGIADLTFRNLSDQFDVIPARGNQVSATGNPPPELGGLTVPIPFGGQVNPATPWQGPYQYGSALGDSGPMLASNRGSLVAYGPFAGLDGYLGIRFYIGSELHYGWIRLNLNNGYPASARGFVTEWAYNSVSDQAIAAGAVPEPGTLALLALGALVLWKLRRPA